VPHVSNPKKWAAPPRLQGDKKAPKKRVTSSSGSSDGLCWPPPPIGGSPCAGPSNVRRYFSIDVTSSTEEEQEGSKNKGNPTMATSTKETGKANKGKWNEEVIHCYLSIYLSIYKLILFWIIHYLSCFG